MSQKLMPTYLEREEFISLLEDCLKRVKEGDSYEGFINYMIPDNPEQNGWMVEMRYRIGNTMGQGGMRIIGEWVEEEI